MGHDILKLRYYVENGLDESIDRILSYGNVDVHEVDPETGNNVLHSAVHNNHLKVVVQLAKYMCEAGVNHQNKAGRTPLFGAKTPEIAAALLSNGGLPNVKDENGETAMHFLARLQPAFGGPIITESAAKKIIAVLLSKGANPSIKNKNGRTAADVATAHDVKAAIAQGIERMRTQRVPMGQWMDAVVAKPELVKSLPHLFLSTMVMDLEEIMFKLKEELTARSTNTKLLCQVCKNNRSNVLFSPCHHVAACNLCSPTLHACPECHKPITTRKLVGPPVPGSTGASGSGAGATRGSYGGNYGAPTGLGAGSAANYLANLGAANHLANLGGAGEGPAAWWNAQPRV